MSCGGDRGAQQGQERSGESRHSRGTFRPNTLPWERGWKPPQNITVMCGQEGAGCLVKIRREELSQGSLRK